MYRLIVNILFVIIIKYIIPDIVLFYNNKLLWHIFKGCKIDGNMILQISPRDFAHIHTHAHAKGVTSRNNPPCQLIDQITSRWNTPPNSDHYTLRLPFRNEAFLFVQSHPRLFLPSRLTSSHLPHAIPGGDIGVVKSRQRHFLFHLHRGIVPCGIINNRP